MKRIRYFKYVPDPAGEMSMEDLLSALSDYLLQSGFQDSMWYEMPEGEHTLDDLKRAIEKKTAAAAPNTVEMTGISEPRFSVIFCPSAPRSCGFARVLLC